MVLYTPHDCAVAWQQNQGTQRRYIVNAKVYIDATGDGRLGAEAGAEWIQGREGAAKYNESLAALELTEFPTDQPGGGPDHETEGTTLDYVRLPSDQMQPYLDFNCDVLGLSDCGEESPSYRVPGSVLGI